MATKLKTQDDSPGELRRKARERFATANRLEAEYLRSLNYLTRQIDHMVKNMGHKPNDLQALLRKYSETIKPWAQSIAEKMVTRIARTDERAWIQLGRSVGRSLREELQSAPTGMTLQKFLNEQVILITSLPLEAAQRVHTLTMEGLADSTRAEEIANEILKTGEVTKSRAKLIARTEVARTASGLTLARAAHVGVTHYIWRTSKDTDVRKSHKEMDGQIIPLDKAPTLSDGTTTHAGQIYNCRCYAEPIISED